jgi:hypothetical protein
VCIKVAGLKKAMFSNRISELVKPDQPIYIVDEALKISPSPKRRSRSPLVQLKPKPTAADRHFSSFERINFPPLPEPTSSSLSEVSDPLDDEHFLKAHRRAERKEKQLRNIEKERAQHEKVQLEHLLECLRGPDWLRVMGVTGITDGARKEWEPKRDYFIREVRALLTKFKVWKEQEKKLLQEKENAIMAKEEEEEAEEEEEEAINDDDDANGDEVEHIEESIEEEDQYDDTSSSANAPDPNDVDAWAARQLLQEAKIATKRPPKRKAPARPLDAAPLRSPSPPKPFTSFFSKPHLRAAALGKSRHGSRTVLAFGHPIPDLPPSEFQLPPEYLTAEALRTHARKRRRLNREKREDKM